MSPRTKFNLVCLAILALVVAEKWHETSAVKPNPDDPNPPPVSRTKVLIIEETAPNPPYTLKQSQALANARNGDIREWMDKEMGQGSSHVWDKDLDVSKQDKVWQDGFAKKPEALPWVRNYNGRRWNNGQTFADSAELKKAIGMK